MFVLICYVLEDTDFDYNAESEFHITFHSSENAVKGQMDKWANAFDEDNREYEFYAFSLTSKRNIALELLAASRPNA